MRRLLCCYDVVNSLKTQNFVGLKYRPHCYMFRRSLSSSDAPRSKTQFRLFEKMFLQYSALMQRYRGTLDPSVPELGELLKAADVEPDLKTYNLLISKLMANGDHIKARQATILRKTHSSLDDNSNIKRDERNNVSNSSISMSSTEVNQEMSLFEGMFLKWSKFMHAPRTEDAIPNDNNNTKSTHHDEELLGKDRKGEIVTQFTSLPKHRLSSKKNTSSQITKLERHNSRNNKRRSERKTNHFRINMTKDTRTKKDIKALKTTKKTKRVVFVSPKKQASSHRTRNNRGIV